MTETNQDQDQEIETVDNVENVEEVAPVETETPTADAIAESDDATESDEVAAETDPDAPQAEEVVAETETETETEPEVEAEKPKRRMRNSDDEKTTGPILDLMHGNLTQAFVEEMQNLEKPWAKLSEAQMRDVIDRCKDRAEHHIRTIANAIGSRGHERCEAFVDTVTVKDGFKGVLKVADFESGIELSRRQGQNVVIVFTDEKDFINGGKFPEPAKDQPGFFDDNAAAIVDGEAEQVADSGDIDPLYDQAVDFVVTEGKVSIDAVQRDLRVGYNRAARLVETMELNGIVSGPNDSGQRTVLGLDEGEAVDTETGEITELGAESMDQFAETEEAAETVAEEAAPAEVLPMLARPGKFDLLVNGNFEADVTESNIEAAVHALGYTEFEVVNQGTDDECARIFDDERIESDGVTIELQYSDNQPATTES